MTSCWARSKVISEPLRVERLSAAHDRSTFSCGNAALDRYLREQAGQDLRRHLSAVFVLFDRANDVVAGYYTLSACEVDPTSLPSEIAKRLPRRPVPATLIGRLAVDLDYRGLGLGRTLLANALIRAAGASLAIGSMAVIVDAKDDQARAFYEHYGFRRFVEDPYRLFIPMAVAIRHEREG
ncbi:MAG: GNAT family N-acetyltransferase [Chloroflexota bacterium]|nr:GNAT family N-acetyltransferase [Chloroflexia bacterium]MDQ3225609.1 GNAT family N-acetyltransferase [Chloroflexota bacterium]